MNKKVIVIGASGHGKVIADIIVKSNDIVVGFLDDGISAGTSILGFPVLGKTSDCINYPDCEFVIGIGNANIRRNITETYGSKVKWYTAIHPSAIIALDVTICEGSVIMANTVINASTQIGQHCIINTGAIIEHDNIIEDFVHISPNATLCGVVHVGENTHIGASATVKNVINITSDVIVGAGSVVIKDIDEKGTYVGVPARRIK